PPPTSIYTLSLHDALPIFPTRAIDATGCLERSIGMSGEKALIVLSHLTDNAIRHNAKTVRLEAVEEDASIRLTVSNDGDPISERSEEHTSELQSPCNLVCR